MAPLPRARSEPGGIFPTADASAPSPSTINHQPLTPPILMDVRKKHDISLSGDRD
ncbi:MAG: hypothetical protein ACHBN1_24640 [Heteroscytonema crispum UTEX LB 1556]